MFVDEYTSKVVCEGQKLRVSCKTGMQIAVYSAMFGRTQEGTLECPPHHWRAPSVSESLGWTTFSCRDDSQSDNWIKNLF